MKNGRPHHKAGRTISLAVIAGLAPTFTMAYDGFKQGDNPAGILKNVTMRWTGFNTNDGKFYPGQMKYNLLPAIAGVMVHKVAGMMGLNRYIASAGIPWVRI